MAECSIRPAETPARMRAEGTSNSKLALQSVRWHAQRAVQQENGLSLPCERRCGSVQYVTCAKARCRGTLAGGQHEETDLDSGARGNIAGNRGTGAAHRLG